MNPPPVLKLSYYCIAPGCVGGGKSGQPKYATRGYQRGLFAYCAGHAHPGMRNVKSKMCVECKETRPSFGLERGKPVTHCARCKLDGMVALMNKRCVECKETEPSFGLERGKPATHCARCKLDGMVDVKSKMCVKCKETRPSFGLERGKPVTHCARCKLDGMVDMNRKMCVECGEHQPSFGLERGKPATHCARCKLDGMVDVNSKMCVECDNTRPSFGLERGKPATHCAGCKLDGMVDVMNKMCVECKETEPSFGLERGKPATHCARCKLDGMVDVKSKMCVECKETEPSFGLERGKPATHCAGCKLDGMVDVKSKMCVECGEHQPSFGLERGKPATHCARCKLDGMVDVKSKMCVECDNTRPSFGLERGKPATHCAGCKLDGMFNVKSKMCVECGEHQPSWGDYCSPCYAKLHPDDPLVKAHLKTEEKVLIYLNETLNAGIAQGSTRSTFNTKNVRGNHAPAWLGARELDFVLFQNKIGCEIDGIQHKKDVKLFKTTASAQQQNDCEKTVDAMDNGMSVVREDGDDVWKERFNWGAVLKAMFVFALSRNEVVCITARRDEADTSYAPYLDLVMQSPAHAARVYEMFLDPNESGRVAVCIHRATGVRQIIAVPETLDMSRMPATPLRPADVAGKRKQLTMQEAFAAAAAASAQRPPSLACFAPFGLA